MADEFSGFDATLFRFLRQLPRNNNREWFQKNKARYESQVLQPSLQFIRAFQPHLKKLSPFFVASDKRVGGSLMRVYRDTRFSKDKRPYKTNVGIHFRHEMCKDVHAPGFYLHIEPKESFLGVGIWHPDNPTLARIRTAIDSQPTRWKRARHNKKFCADFELAGDSLKTPPRGFDKDHPLLEDLKRKDFIGVKSLTRDDILDGNLVKNVSAAFANARPLMRFLCEAIEVPF